MEIKRYTKKDIKQLTKSKPIPGTFNIFEDGNGIIKIYKDPMFDLMKFGTIVFPNGLVNEEQIKFLATLQSEIYNSKMPNGIVYFEKYPVGVTYPVYFKNYSDFSDLTSLSLEEMIKKFRKATDNNIELLEHHICNADFTLRNILHNESDVQLIDLDGKYIHKDLPYSFVYSYFVFGMTKQIYDKCISCLEDKSRQEIIGEIKRRIEIINQKDKTIDYPHQVLDEIEKTKILNLK